MHRLWARVILLLASFCCILATSGCQPSPDPTWSKPTPGKPASVGSWSVIAAAVAKSKQAGKYDAVYNVHMNHAGSRHVWSGDAKADTMGQFLLRVNADTIGYLFYQQGHTAYADHSGQWQSVPPLTSTNPFARYTEVVRKAQKQKLALSALPRQFVGNEYCSKFRAVVPAGWLKAAPTWQSYLPQAASGNVSMTFYIGQQSHQLRFVETISTGTVQPMGPVEIDTNIEFYFEGVKTKMILPSSLTRQLGSALTG